MNIGKNPINSPMKIPTNQMIELKIRPIKRKKVPANQMDEGVGRTNQKKIKISAIRIKN
jgi:hypothetical protein